MPTSSQGLLQQIAELRSAIDGFSFDQMSIGEAKTLKSRFEAFCRQLEDKIWDPGAGEEASAELPEASRDSQMLIATVSHEIRTPLSGIIGFTDLLSESPLGEREAEYVGAIRSAAHGLLEIVNELREFSTIESGTWKAASIPFNPKQVLGEVGYLCKTLIVRDNVAFRTEIARDLPDLLLGDPSKLSQILMNLLGNAIKFTASGHITLRMRCEWRKRTCTLHGEVEDTGPGIQPSDLGLIFNPFHQGGQTGETQGIGTGLGLSIVKKIIERQGGAIWAESEPGSGSRFSFRLPYTLGTTSPEPGTLQEPESPDEKRLEGKRILVFEDNPLNMKLLETRLKSWGCHVYRAEQAAYGMALLQKNPVDLILMDLHLPQANGFELSRQIRNHSEPGLQNIPIIAVTADFTARDEERRKASGIDDVLLKPYVPAELFGRLEFYLQNGRAVPNEAHSRPEKLGKIDVQALWAECSGDMDVLEQLIGLLKNNLLEFIGKIRLHLPTADYAQITAAAHKVKSGLRMVRAGYWLEHVEAIHQLSKQETGLGEIGQRFDELAEDFPRLEAQLEREVEKLKKDQGHG
ncbi:MULTISPECIES: ATP-binding protein [unclassified Robiginitalea]|uniref:ATP-binding protein n=1 Tax=Robiginitalea TaxID=252306 RepID=UPI002349843C|nr:MULTISPECIES: ATP-binding protein [unclassified Robiginitalea]MDC6354084.1 ATP-binding protein [Robiginitalea sp. PM2]MDC6374351.1 ATP-binding protein [Robiginitalea sp. SP8]